MTEASGYVVRASETKPSSTDVHTGTSARMQARDCARADAQAQHGNTARKRAVLASSPPLHLRAVCVGRARSALATGTPWAVARAGAATRNGSSASSPRIGNLELRFLSDTYLPTFTHLP
eukprot:2119635-Pleurochrysis_carterae.AAC.8